MSVNLKALCKNSTCIAVSYHNVNAHMLQYIQTDELSSLDVFFKIKISGSKTRC